MSAMYFYRKNKVVIVTERLTAHNATVRGLTGLQCIDMFCDSDAQRYGGFHTIGGWESLDKLSMSKTFRTTVLLIHV